MFDIHVERVINAPIERVFDAIADHESYVNYKGISIAKVVEPGETEKNGKGALRHMGGKSMELHERITLFERPVRMHYKVERSRPYALDHRKGEITLSAEGEKTRVVWESQGRIKVPLVGRLLDRRAGQSSARLFGSILKGIDAALAEVA